MLRIRSIEPLGGFRVRLSLTDGSIREIDLGPYLNGPVFEARRSCGPTARTSTLTS
jgi:hypothetical protein